MLQYCDFMHKICKTLRTKPFWVMIGTICPSSCTTRWSNIYLIVKWMFSHRKDIILLIYFCLKEYEKVARRMEKDLIYLIEEIIPWFIKLFGLSSCAIKQLEGDSTSSSDIFPILTNLNRKMGKSTELMIYQSNSSNVFMEGSKKLEN